MIDEKTAASGRYELLVQSVVDYAIYMMDPTGNILSWNAGAERFKGYTEDEILGQNFARFYSDEDQAAGLPQIALETAAIEGRFEADGWRFRKDGSRFWANVVIDCMRDPSGGLVGFAKITRDVTRRREVEQELRHSEERFRLLVQNVTDYAIYMLDTEGRVSSWNAGAERIMGYRADEVIGLSFARFYPADAVTEGAPQRALAQTLAAGQLITEGWRQRKDGTRFWASVVMSPVHTERGDLLGFAKVTRDLTERRKAQREIENAQESAFQSKKMEAIGQLTGGVAHDFNNLLAAIIGSVDIAKRKLAAGDDATRFLDNALHAAQRGTSLTRRMLAFARKQEMKLQTVNLADLVHGMEDMLKRLIGAEISIENRIPARIPGVRADLVQLELALINLAVNARDAMPNGGCIRICATTMSAQARDALTPGHYIALSISDEGDGMDAETLARATDPFFTTKDVGKGTGLGLSMVAGIADQFGGKIALDSIPGRGTTVTLWLPVADGDNTALREPSPTAATAPIRAMTVLAVDDDDIVLINTATMLADMGHTVFAAASGAEALQILAREAVDLLLTDFAMPQMSGYDLADAAVARWPDLQVLVVSGYTDMTKTPGRYARLSKPFTREDLAQAVAQRMQPATL